MSQESREDSDLLSQEEIESQEEIQAQGENVNEDCSQSARVMDRQTMILEHDTTAMDELCEKSCKTEPQSEGVVISKKAADFIDLTDDNVLLSFANPPKPQRYVSKIKIEKIDDAFPQVQLPSGSKLGNFYVPDDLPDLPLDPWSTAMESTHFEVPDAHPQNRNNEETLVKMLQQFNNNQGTGHNLNEYAGEGTSERPYGSSHSKYEHGPYAESPVFFPDRSESPDDVSPYKYDDQQGADSILISDSEDLTGTWTPSTSLKEKGKAKKSDPGTKTRNYKKRTQKNSNNNGAQSNDLIGLFHNDIIAQAQENQHLEKQPVLTGANRHRALKSLLASLPAGERDLYRGDKKQLDEAAKIFTGRGRKVTNMKSGGEQGWKLQGMKSYLQHHQMLGAHFMRRREIDGNPNGGVLGDVMGFGKTIICLANLVDGMPLPTYKGPRATLIVVPSSLMGQWRGEIKKHVEAETLRNIAIYGPGSRWIDNDPDPVAELGRYDVVITSYHEVMNSMPLNQPPECLTTEKAKLEWWDEHFEKTKGYLHRVQWYRVVLDESQIIKNHLSRTSMAARALEGRFRWVLSGTPVLNNLKEWYATLDFLKLPIVGSYELFCKNFCKKGSIQSLQRLQATIDQVMLRRTHKDKMFGRPIVKLPPVSNEDIYVTFNSVERSIYSIIADRFRKNVAPSKPGEKNYRSHFVLLLRLRQLVGHPLLIQKTLRDVLEAEDLERLWALTEPSRTLSGAASTDGSVQTAKALEAALKHSLVQTTLAPRDRASDNELSSVFRKYLQNLHDTGEWAKSNERLLCAACANPPKDALVTPCKHLYCKDCLDQMAFEEQSRGGRVPSCLDCGMHIEQNAPYRSIAFEEAAKRRNSTSDESVEESSSWYDLPGPMLRSAKINACIGQIKAWFHQDATHKVIVFVQFRGLIRILSRIMDEEQWGHTTYDGSMSPHAKDQAITKFSTESQARILIAALKAGGVGLNLTAANKVIILDCWWHVLQEQQAWSRAYRIGQTRDVEVKRFLVRNSIDEKIKAMQEYKTQELNSIITEGERPKLSMADLVKLFGDLDEDTPPHSQNPRKRKRKAANNDNGDAENIDDNNEGFIRPDDPYDDRINGGDVDFSEMN